MKNRRICLAALGLALQGCAVVPERSLPEPRLDTFRDRQFDPGEGAALDLDGATVRAAYEGYLQQGQEPRWRREVQRRLADLEVEGAVEPKSGSDDYHSAIRQYETLLAETPSGPQREPLLYGLARALAQQGEAERQQPVMAQLLREFPDSAYRTELEFRTAEYLFSQKRYREAASAYEAVLAHQELSTFQERARYKLAWSLHRDHRYSAAVNRFLEMFRYRMTPQLVAAGEGIEDLALSEGDRQLMQDVVRGVALAASSDDDVKLKQRFTTPADEPFAYLVYGALVERYVDQSRYHDAAETAREFVQRWPRHAAAPRLQLRLLEVIALGGFTARLEEERADFVDRYHPLGEHWRLLGATQRQLLAEPLQQSLIGLAQRGHAMAQRTRTARDYRLAIHWYRRFLDGFPDHPQAWRMSFLLGDALYENRQFDEAAPAYEKSAYQYPRHEQSADAGFAALSAYRKHEETLAASEFRDHWHWLGVSSALAFINRFSDDARATPLLATTAQELYALHRYQRASDVARLLLVRQPAPEPAVLRTAWTVLGYSEFELGHYEEAERAYREVLAMTDSRAPERPQRIEWLAAAIYKQAEQARANGNQVSAASHFMRVGELAPDTKIRVTADYDAAASMIAAMRWHEAIGLLLHFRATYGNSPLQNSVSEKLAVAYMRDGRDRDAALEFEAIAAKRAEAKEKSEALTLAAELYEKAGDTAAQVRLLRRYVKEYPSPLEPAMEARATLAAIAQRQGDLAGRDQWYRAMIEANGQHRGEQTVRTNYLASRSQLELARPQFDAFAQIRLVAPLTQSLQRKKSLMEAALASYDKVLDYSSAETTTEATWHIAEVQRLFGRALMESERPTNLTAEELEQYEMMLEERAFPFEENAIKVHASNTARIPQGIYDEWVRRSMAALVELKPAHYNKQELGEEVFGELR